MGACCGPDNTEKKAQSREDRAKEAAARKRENARKAAKRSAFAFRHDWRQSLKQSMYAFGVMSLLCLWGYHDRDSWYLRFVAALCVWIAYILLVLEGPCLLGWAFTKIGQIVDPSEGAKIGAVLISPWIGRDAVGGSPRLHIVFTLLGCAMTDVEIEKESSYGFVGWADAVHIRMSLDWSDVTAVYAMAKDQIKRYRAKQPMRDVILRIDEIRVQKATGVMELVRGELNYRLFKRRVAEDEVRQHFERVPNYLKCSIIAYEHLSTQRVRPTIECVLRERRFETTRGTKQGPGEASAWAAVFEAPAPDCAAVLEIAATPNQGKNYHFGDWGVKLQHLRRMASSVEKGTGKFAKLPEKLCRFYGLRKAQIAWGADYVRLRGRCELRSAKNPEVVQGLVRFDLTWSYEPLAPNALQELAVFQRGALDQYLTYSHEKGVMYRTQTNADPYHDPMKVACAGFRIEELRIQLDAFFEHVDERVEESNVHKTAAKEKLLELEAETDARIAAQKELEDSEFVKDSLTLDAGCRDAEGRIQGKTAWDFVTDVENDAIDQLTRDGDFKWSVLTGATRYYKRKVARDCCSDFCAKERAGRRRCAYKWRRCRYDCLFFWKCYKKSKYVSQRDVGCLSEGTLRVEGLLLKRRATKCCCCLQSEWRLVHAAIRDDVLYYAPRCAGCDVGTTKRLPLHCVSAKYFAQKGILRLTVKKGGAGRPRGIAFDFAVPFSQSGLRGLAPAPPYKPDAGEIRPWHDAVRDAKCDALAREEN